MEQKRIVRVVVASPGDVQAERDTLPAVFDELNLGIAAERNLLLELLRWETDAYPSFHPEGPQGLIDPILNIEDCDILIGLFWKRFGTPTKDTQSGTEHEILSAYQAWQQNRRPQIMVYFNQKAYTPASKEETDQWGEVLDFKRRFPQEGLWWAYKGRAEFERLVRNHLTGLIRDQYPLNLQSQARAETARVLKDQEDARGRSTDELTKEYLVGLAERVSKVYLFGEEEARALDKVFVELSIVEEYRRPTAQNQFLGLMDAEMRKRRSDIMYPKEHESRGAEEMDDTGKAIVKPDELLRGRTKVVVTGAPGCGKTTLLHYLAWRTGKANERFPVFLELKTVTEGTFNRAQHDLAKLLFDEAVVGTLDLYGVERERFREFFMARLSAGETAIFLDGLDEVSGTDFFPRLCDAISGFVRRTHRGNTLILSTRPYALQSRLEGLKEMEIAPLNQRQIEEFFAHYYGDDPRAQRLLRTLWQRRPLRELLRVPFLLAAVTQLYRQQQHVVEDRLELYRQLVWQLVVQLDREKRLVRHDFRIADRTGALKLDFLKYLACERLLIDEVLAEGREAARLTFTGDVILEKAKQFWRNAEHPPGSPYDLADDVKSTPLLREIGADVYAFTHLTIQEYLAAVELSRRDDCEKIFCRSYFNSTVAEMEVLPMTLGLINNPKKLYAAITGLPESLTLTELRLLARSSAYVQKIDASLLEGLIERLLDFIHERHPDEMPYRFAVFRSFSGARGPTLELIMQRLKPLTRHPRSEVRRNTVRALGFVGSELAVDALLEALRDDESVVRLKAAAALEFVGSELAVDALLEALRDEDTEVRQRAAVALGFIGSERAVDALLLTMEDRDFLVFNKATGALKRIGSERAINKMLSWLRNKSSHIRQRGATALGQISGERVLAPLLEALKDRDSFVRGSAASALGVLGDERAVDSLLKTLKDKHYPVRRKAASALGHIGDERAVDALVEALKDADFSVRKSAATALGKIADECSVDALIEALRDETGPIRGDVAVALGLIGSERAFFTLLGALNDYDPSVRRKAASALGQIGDKRAVGALIKVIKDKDGTVRQSAAKALRSIGGDHALAALQEVLHDEKSDSRIIAATALNRVDAETAVDALLGAMRDGNSSVRQTAAIALNQISPNHLSRALLKTLSSDNAFLRRKAAQFVGYYAEGEQVLNKLVQLAAGDISEEVRIAAREASAKYERKLVYFR